jgi:tRNA (Thr-GGU) A37 N-methylase
VLAPIGYVAALRQQPEDDFWALQGLADFSHAEVLFVFHEVAESQIVTGARHPRNNNRWPAVGIFAQRGKNRPNRIGTSLCRIVRIGDSTVVVAELDATDGTPVLDIKPVMAEFLPLGTVRQPQWSHELMRDYWKEPGG